MGVKPQTLKLLKRLATDVTKEPTQDRSARGRWRAIPATLLPPTEGASSDGTASLILTLDETNLYQECLEALVAEPELEHLLSERKIEREIDDLLWELVCDLFLNR